jgi:hypothetical protein
MLHTTQNGDTIPIPCLEDSHLVNIVKYPFKKYLSLNETENKKISFLLGENIQTIDVNKYNDIIKKVYLYVIEGLRRDSTRDLILEFLSKYNPVFENKERIEAKVEYKKLKNDFFDYQETDEDQDYESF